MSTNQEKFKPPVLADIEPKDKPDSGTVKEAEFKIKYSFMRSHNLKLYSTSDEDYWYANKLGRLSGIWAKENIRQESGWGRTESS
jgi:hypothetical protein